MVFLAYVALKPDNLVAFWYVLGHKVASSLVGPEFVHYMVSEVIYKLETNGHCAMVQAHGYLSDCSSRVDVDGLDFSLRFVGLCCLKHRRAIAVGKLKLQSAHEVILIYFVINLRQRSVSIAWHVLKYLLTWPLFLQRSE